MSQISKCPKLRVVLGYWEALGEVSEMRYNNLLYCSSKRSYCSFMVIHGIWLISRVFVEEEIISRMFPKNLQGYNFVHVDAALRDLPPKIPSYCLHFPTLGLNVEKHQQHVAPVVDMITLHWRDTRNLLQSNSAL